MIQTVSLGLRQTQVDRYGLMRSSTGCFCGISDATLQSDGVAEIITTTILNYRGDRPSTPRNMEDYVEITHKGFKFLISKNPTNKTIDTYIKEMKKHNVQIVIRVCKPSYDTDPLHKAGIHVYDLTIEDGASPSEEILEMFFDILKKQYHKNPEACVAVHCVAGLGRAPVLIAVALIELGYSYEDAVDLIRTKRRGAINAKQLEYLSKYKPKSRLLGEGRKTSCSIQ